MKEEKEEKKDVKEVKKDEKKEIKEEVKEEKTSAKETDEKKEKKAKKEVKNINSQEYVDECIRKRKKRIKIAIISVISIILIAILSTIFGLITMINNKIISKTTINGVKVSGMTRDEAKEKIEEEFKNQYSQKLEFEYEEYSNEFTSEEIDTNYKIDEAIDKAYDRGRDSNLIGNNINVIKSFFVSEEIKIETEYDKEKVDKIISDMAGNIPGKVTEYTYCIEDEELIITPGKRGMKLDEDKTRELIEDRIVNLAPDKKIEKIKLPVFESDPKDIDIEKIYEEIHSEPKDAYIEEEPFKVVVDEDGIDFAISMEEAKAILKEPKEEYIIPLKIQKANITVNDLGERAFPDKLSTFTTKYDSTNYNRTTNLALATEKINGKVLMPGEVFSYNQTLGKRTIENGYKAAAIYANGGVEDGLGGGICQISSTLYNAVVMANLEIVERHNHMFVTSYADASRDATVSYGSLDFQFKNTRKYPIKIVASVSNGIATASIYGLKEDPEYTVQITHARTGSIPFSVEEIPDPELPAGETVVKQNGSNGCRSVAYKEIYLDGVLVSKELLSSDTYSAMNRIIRVGTGPAAATPEPEPAPAPEPAPVPEPEPAPEPEPTTQPSTDPENP